MSWLVFLLLAGVPALWVVDVSGPSARGGGARWWRGRALVSTVLHFCLALAGAALMVLALGPHAR
ncbi:hypothetical protein [Hydrogenophaga sp.]|uniref:hypothetical protein n=1 Tax=Hydrogenophaga sp. TaxID=1904254 RepID=UPI003F721629